ncbi:MAG TPA: YqgE/AlgH family protein [Hyphomicrobiaceae bacterium]|nr:YqgE/AlgH family protein [Hyphomicrobiaceae bacterium]
MDQARKRRVSGSSYLSGQLLVAMPTMGDRRFRRSVIYMCSHSAEGAMGLIVNQRSPDVSLGDLVEQLGLGDGGTDTFLEQSVLNGGPVSTERGFVLHTNDYFAEEATLAIGDGICLTATIEILKAMAAGQGPRRSVLALGYAGWAPGQLEAEIGANGWLHCPADRDLIFDTDLELKYVRALSKIGVELSHLHSEAGHA